MYEAPHGITVRHLIYDIGGGVPDGHTLKAVMMGGSSFPVMTPDDLDTPLDADSLGKKGYFIGSGVVTVIDERTCIVQFALRVAQFYMHESCGKCTPCRVGTRWLVQLMRAVEDGTATERDLELTLDVCDRIIGKCLCVLGDSAAMPVASCVTKFRDEFREHLAHGGCPFGDDSQLAGLFAPVDQHAHTPVSAGGARMSTRARPRHDRRARRPRPEGDGAVETALAAGVEIPVFCYEPRLGAPVGACRMCLVEVEGMPKLQAGCTLTAQDGMVVKTARTSEQAAEGQNATLEFILVNHPLDCPVCDKGGECPLQDLTFRYGPGNTRMSFEKLDLREADPDLAHDLARPRALHPLLPLHALQRGASRRTASSSPRTAARCR